MLHLQFQLAELFALVFEFVHEQLQLGRIAARNRNRRLRNCRSGRFALDFSQRQVFQVHGQFSLALWLPYRPATDITRRQTGAQLPATGIRRDVQVMYRLTITTDFLNLQSGSTYGCLVSASTSYSSQRPPSFQ